MNFIGYQLTKSTIQVTANLFVYDLNKILLTFLVAILHYLSFLYESSNFDDVTKILSFCLLDVMRFI